VNRRLEDQETKGPKDLETKGPGKGKSPFEELVPAARTGGQGNVALKAFNLLVSTYNDHLS